MKKTKTYVKSHRLSEMTLALHKLEGLPGMSVTEIKGFGPPCDATDHKYPKDDPGDSMSIS